MTRSIEAVYENGVLRPLEPVALPEHQHVVVLIDEANEPEQRAYRDMAYLEAVRREVAAMDAIPTIEEILAITSRDPGSWADAISDEREDRF
jgi:predicted DNA-binding antitoxin AbrB/MazE fold protein